MFRAHVRLLVTLTAAIALVASSYPAHAITNSANTLKVSPVRTDIQVLPGETRTVPVTITNITGGDITVSPIENDFIAADESGNPSLILDADKFAPTHSLKRFMTPLADVMIPARESKTIDVTITVPKTAQAGGYFGAIRFAPSDPDSGGQVNLSASVASLILVTVPGDLTEKLNLTDFEVQQDGHAGSLFHSEKGVATTFRFENKGNVQVAPFGQITVKQGKTTVYQTEFNTKDPREVVLPDSARRWTVPLEKISGFGHYTVTATLTYGQKNQTVEVSKSFWVVPVGLIITVAIAVVIAVVLGLAIWYFLRSYKRKILSSQSQRGRYRR